MIKAAVWSIVLTMTPLVAAPSQTAKLDAPMFAFQVETPVRAVPGNPVPTYPNKLRAANIQGTVFAKFVVDTAGRVELQTFEVLKSDDSLFTNAVRAVLPELRFFPATIGTRKVRQLVQMPFAFALRP